MNDNDTDWDDFPYMRSFIFQHGSAGEVEGTTAFFRNLGAFTRLLMHLSKSELSESPKILVAPCSIGCEAYTLAIMADRMGLFERYPNLKIYGLDIADVYLSAARIAEYHLNHIVSVPLSYRSYFIRDHEHGKLLIPDRIRERVTFLPRQNVLHHTPADGVPYDAVTCFNLFFHLPYQAQKISDHLLSISKVLCFDSTNMFGEEDALRELFKTASQDPIFFAVDQGTMPTPTIGWDAPQTEFKRIKETRGQDDAILICRAFLG